MQIAAKSNLLGLDVGHVRIGIAIASADAGLPRPLTTIAMNDQAAQQILNLAKSEEVDTLVVGLPRNLNGDDTAQTKYVRDFVQQLERAGLTTVLQDEALTSKRAEAELRSRKSIKGAPTVDELAATYILEDYLGIYPEQIL